MAVLAQKKVAEPTRSWLFIGQHEGEIVMIAAAWLERIKTLVGRWLGPSQPDTGAAGRKSGTQSAVSAEIQKIEKIRQISSALADIEGVTGVGPLDEDERTCIILATPAFVNSVPETARIKDGEEVRLRVVTDEGEARLYMGGPPVTNAPRQFPGPVMGGDPVRNNAFTQHGTIAFGVEASAQTTVEGNACAGQILGCSHVFFHASGNTVSTPLQPDGFQTQWNVRQNTPRFIDVAGAMPTGSSVNVKPRWLRGLREITGAEFPAAGVRVSKYGQASGLTSGLIRGPAERNIDGTKVIVRFVKRRFAVDGDSGAAVVAGDRKLVGLVFAGHPLLDESYVLQAWPDTTTIPIKYAAFRIENF